MADFSELPRAHELATDGSILAASVNPTGGSPLGGLVQFDLSPWETCHPLFRHHSRKPPEAGMERAGSHSPDQISACFRVVDGGSPNSLR